MKLNITLFAMTLLAGLLAVPGAVRADQDPAKDGKQQVPANARTILEKGRASGPLPEGMVIRLGACLGEPAVKAAGDRTPEGLLEKWEFTANQVHRVVPEYKEDKLTYDRVESRPFDSKSLCKDLLEGKAIEIQARTGVGPEVALAGTPYRRGSRFIEVVWNGETILDLHETNGAGLNLYRESDARAFGALYERLASQVRVSFKPAADEEGGPTNGHEFVCGDYVQNKIMVIGRDGQVKWEYPAPLVCDLWVLDNGNFLFTAGHGVVEVNREKKVVFKYETTSEVFSCQRLPDGNTLVAETTAGRLVIVDPAGKVVKVVPLLQAGEKGDHGYVANVRQLANGHFMAAIYQGQLVREYDDDGKVVMQASAPSGGRVAVRLANGHTLIGTADCTDEPRLFEVDAAGKVTWEFSNADLPGKQLRHICGIHRLPNGNTVLCNYLGHGQFGKAPQLIEITPDKKVVWTYGNHKVVRAVTCVQMLEAAGEKSLR